eukprot:Platyproteum_vivax@DN17466_c0_g1_i1.p1
MHLSICFNGFEHTATTLLTGLLSSTISTTNATIVQDSSSADFETVSVKLSDSGCAESEQAELDISKFEYVGYSNKTLTEVHELETEESVGTVVKFNAQVECNDNIVLCISLENEHMIGKRFQSTRKRCSVVKTSNETHTCVQTKYN